MQTILIGCGHNCGATTRPHGQGFCTQPSLRANPEFGRHMTDLPDGRDHRSESGDASP
ncbi:MAG: hypothetical protein SPL13_02790 [Clostridia bacterium]|nr:hypothetical protein [Clostridia bacterium]